jgi:uncharacterized protein
MVAFLVWVALGQAAESAGGESFSNRSTIDQPQISETPDPLLAAQKMYAAAARGNVTDVKALIANNPGVINATEGNGYGSTPLHFAAYNGHGAVVSLLLENGANVNAVNKYGVLPLHDAASQGHKDIVAILLANKSVVNARDGRGRTPLQCALENHHNDVADLLRQAGANAVLPSASAQAAELLRAETKRNGTGQTAEVMPPKPAVYFNDYASVVPAGTAQQLNKTLEDFEKATSSQLVVAIFQKMQTDSSMEDYTHRIFESWKVGQKDKNNGIVLFVFVQDRKMRIEVGYGLEGALPDAIAKRIIEDEIKPHFKNGDYAGGMTAGVTAMIKATRGEYKGTGVTRSKNGRSYGISPFWIVVFLVVFFRVVWPLMLLFRGGTTYRRSGRNSGWSIGWGGGGGGWSSGGGGGGGFSGGGFSGGGASGSW